MSINFVMVSKTILWYVGLTLLLILLGILQVLGLVRDAFGMFIMLVMGIALFISFRFKTSKGNIADYDLSKFKLVWKDELNRDGFENVLIKLNKKLK